MCIETESGRVFGKNKTKKPKQGTERESVVRSIKGRPFALRAVVGNVSLARTGVIAWYTLDPKSVSFRPDSEIETLIAHAGASLADLVGHRVFFRVTTRPVAVAQLADRTWQDSVARTAGPLPGAEDMLVREQVKLHNADLSEKFVFIGVRVATSRRYPSDPRREVAALKPVLEKVRATVGVGIEARPSTPAEMDLLLRRSFALGMPLAPAESHALGDWDTDDLPALAADIEVTTAPWAKTATVRGWAANGEPQQVRVAVLTMGRLGEMHVPQDGLGGWMHRADRLPFPVEWMATVDVLSDEKVNAQVRHQIDVIGDQYTHYTVEHGKPAPRQLSRQNDLALTVEDELSKGLGGLATRTHGWYRLAVWGQTDEEVAAKVEVIRALYGRQVEWWWSSGQYDLTREFVPHEPLANAAQRRRLTAPSVMAALPAATAEIGDGYGALVGQASGISKRPMLWAMWRDMEVRNRSGLAFVTGGLGSGKSVLCGLLVYMSAMMGSRWTIFDPSGRLGKLCELPELKPYARHTNLLAGRDGELNPYAVLSDPRPEHYRDPRQSDAENRREHGEAVEATRAQRKSLCLDMLTALLPKALRQDSRALSVLRAAVAVVPGDRQSSPLLVLDQLKKIAHDSDASEWTVDHRIAARDVVGELEIFAGTPKGRLVFGKHVEHEETQHDRVLLQVYSLNGLRVPTARQIEMGDESSDARQSQVLFNLAAWLTQQSIYQGDPRERKGLFIDEAHLLSAFDEGVALMEKSSVDSRKHNARVLLCSQNVNHFDVERLSPLASAVFIGRTTEEKAAAEALKLAGLVSADAYVRELSGLSSQPPRSDSDPDEDDGGDYPHEFIFSTKDLGMVERITVFGDQHPHVMEALDSTPNRRPRKGEEHSHEAVAS